MRGIHVTSNVIARSQPIRRVWTSNVTSAINSELHKWNDSRVGEDDPEWRDKVAKGLPATNPYACYERVYIEMQPMNCRVNRYGKTSGALYSYTHVVGLDPTWVVVPALSEDSTVTNDVYAKFNRRVMAFISPIKGLSFLGELREAVGMVKGRTKQLLTDVIKYRDALDREAKRARRNFSNKVMTRDLIKRASDLWLEYVFGWAPLVDDIENAREILVRNRAVVKKVSAKADALTVLGEPYTTVSTTQGVPYNDYATTMRSRKQVSHTFSKVVGAIDTRLLRDGPPGMAADLGLTLEEFVPALWELTPNSFLFDYFTNIGDIIGSLFSEKRALLWISQTTKVLGRSEYTSRIVSLHKGPYDYAAIDGTPTWPYVLVLARKLRRFKPSNTIPSFQLSYPDLGSLKYLNMVTLLTSRIKI